MLILEFQSLCLIWAIFNAIWAFSAPVCVHFNIFPCHGLFWLSSFLPRESCESENATSSLPSSYPSSPTENGTLTTGTRTRPNSKSTLEENAYEDIVGKQTNLKSVERNLDLSLVFCPTCKIALSGFDFLNVLNVSTWALGNGMELFSDTL